VPVELGAGTIVVEGTLSFDRAGVVGMGLEEVVGYLDFLEVLGCLGALGRGDFVGVGG
jgi:hypothetical protein